MYVRTSKCSCAIVSIFRNVKVLLARTFPTFTPSSPRKFDGRPGSAVPEGGGGVEGWESGLLDYMCMTRLNALWGIVRSNQQNTCNRDDFFV